MKRNDALANAISAALISPNEYDTNYEAANVVDGLFALARALNRVAAQLKRFDKADEPTRMGAEQ
jgi:predicted RNA-binding protein associated with RNAse of E/G family